MPFKMNLYTNIRSTHQHPLTIIFSITLNKCRLVLFENFFFFGSFFINKLFLSWDYFLIGSLIKIRNLVYSRSFEFPRLNQIHYSKCFFFRCFLWLEIIEYSSEREKEYLILWCRTQEYHLQYLLLDNAIITDNQTVDCFFIVSACHWLGGHFTNVVSQP